MVYKVDFVLPYFKSNRWSAAISRATLLQPLLMQAGQSTSYYGHRKICGKYFWDGQDFPQNLSKFYHSKIITYNYNIFLKRVKKFFRL